MKEYFCPEGSYVLKHNLKCICDYTIEGEKIISDIV